MQAIVDNAGTILVLLILLAVIARAILVLRNDHKHGRSCCGGNCSCCGMNCHKLSAQKEKL